MPTIRLRPNVAYDWMSERREGGKEYEMGEGEAEYVRTSGFEFDPDEPEPSPVSGQLVAQGRFKAAIAKDMKAAEKGG
jgi:hypothetical protein